ncbi:MAG: hypothetical protein ACXWV2_07940 [Chitinophagaceae bacterium]
MAERSIATLQNQGGKEVYPISFRPYPRPDIGSAKFGYLYSP